MVVPIEETLVSEGPFPRELSAPAQFGHLEMVAQELRWLELKLFFGRFLPLKLKKGSNSLRFYRFYVPFLSTW